jgi:hypothetical protein
VSHTEDRSDRSPAAALIHHVVPLSLPRRLSLTHLMSNPMQALCQAYAYALT